jgi:hypothetical protein
MEPHDCPACERLREETRARVACPAPALPILSTLAEMEQQVIDKMLNHEPPLLRAADVHAFRSILHPHTMLTARAGWVDGNTSYTSGAPYSSNAETRAQAERVVRGIFPLPPRKVLREEVDPGYASQSYRVNGRLQWRNGQSDMWADMSPCDIGDCILARPGCAAIFADLLANPYREEPQ